MPRNDLAVVLRYLRKVGEGRCGTDFTDAELLDRFRTNKEESAFVILLQRHGPMVLNVCRRMLGSREDAEDAFQATFVLLATKAASIREKGSLGSWLHGVAQRVALNARKTKLRRHARERQAFGMSQRAPFDGPTWEELRLVLDEELGRLPEKYRAPVVLCYLEGKTNEHAARELGCPKSSLGWRLGRARELLGQALARRGVALPVGALAAALLTQEATAALPALLVIATTRAATSLETGGAKAAGIISGKVIALVKGLQHTMALHKWKMFIALFFLTGLGALGVLAGTAETPTHEAADLKENTLPFIAAQPETEKADAKPDVADRKQAQMQADGKLHIELLKWIATDVDAAKGTISARATWRGDANERRDGLMLSEVSVAGDAKILVNGAPGALTDLRTGMILSLRLADGAPRITTVVAVKPQAALTSDVLEAVDLERRQVSVKLADTNAVVTLPVADDVEVVIDGKPAQLENLRGYSRVSVQLVAVKSGLVVKAIRAFVMPTR